MLSLLFFIPSFIFAGEISGTIKKDGVALAEQEIKIFQGDKVVATTKTDKNGYFSVNIAQVGRYKLGITGYEGASFDVVSTNSSISYTLSVVKVEGAWQIKKQ
jgi:orotate phosphoribosyltransferase-like protein